MHYQIDLSKAQAVLLAQPHPINYLRGPATHHFPPITLCPNLIKVQEGQTFVWPSGGGGCAHQKILLQPCGPHNTPDSMMAKPINDVESRSWKLILSMKTRMIHWTQESGTYETFDLQRLVYLGSWTPLHCPSMHGSFMFRSSLRSLVDMAKRCRGADVFSPPLPHPTSLYSLVLPSFPSLSSPCF